MEIERYYRILEIEPYASQDIVKQAYRDLVNVWHPDRFSNNLRLRQKAEEKMKEINEAYEIILSAPNNQQSNNRDNNQSQDTKSKTYSGAPKNRIVVPSINYEMIYINPGTFMMGTYHSVEDLEGALDAALDSGDDTYEIWISEPFHKVTLSKGFYIGKTVVTQGQWHQILGNRPWKDRPQFQNLHNKVGDNYPAVFISWDDCNKFIERLNTIENTNKFRFPTEAEWEYSCRAGTEGTWFFQGDKNLYEMIYPNDVIFNQYVWWNDIAPTGPSSGKKFKDNFCIHEVAQKNPNPWGLYDILGNVHEWCQDWYTTDISKFNIDPTGPSSGKIIKYTTPYPPAGPFRVIRGGSFTNRIQVCSSAYRLHSSIYNHSKSRDVGFRLAKSI